MPDKTNIRRLNRFSPDRTLFIEPLSEIVAPTPLKVLERIGFNGLPAKAVAVCWVAIVQEADAALGEATISSVEQEIPIKSFHDGWMKRGGARAVDEICSRLKTIPPRYRYDMLFSSLPYIDGRTLRWQLAPTIRYDLRRSFRLDFRAVELFFRIELSVALHARTRWSFPLYTALGCATIRNRPNADTNGWIALEIPTRKLAQIMGWRGFQLKDFPKTALKPAVADIGGSGRLTRASPRFLEISSVETHGGAFSCKLRRLGSTGAPLDSAPLRDTLKAARRTVIDGAEQGQTRRSPDIGRKFGLMQGNHW